MAKSSLMQKKRDGEKAQMEENKKREKFAELENAIKEIDELGKTLPQKEKQTPEEQEKQGSAGAVYKKAVEEMGVLEKKLKKEMV